MARTAILSDVHSNLPALEAVLADVDRARVSSIVFGGDLVGYAASPREVVDRIRAIDAPSVFGNHDWFTKLMFGRADADLPQGWPDNPVWAAIILAIREMDRDALEWLWSLPMRMECDGAVLAHASLHDADQWPYLHDETSAEPTLAILRREKKSAGFFGHTHHQAVFFDRNASAQPRLAGEDRVFIPDQSICAITVGSVGQPRNRGDNRATWAVWDSDERIVELRKTAYPAGEAAKAVLAAGLPVGSAIRLLRESEVTDFLRDLPPL